jgi:hypothetical protein
LFLHIIIYYVTLTQKQAENATTNMQNYPMIDLMQGITHVHLKNTKCGNKPKCIEQQVESSSFGATALIALRPRTWLGTCAITSHLNYWHCIGLGATSCLLSDYIFDLCCCFGWPRLGRVQEILSRTDAAMASSCILHHITLCYCKILNRNFKYLCPQ